MKDVFTARYASQFQTLLESLASSLEETVGDVDGVSEFAVRARERSDEDNLVAWNECVLTVLTRQHAKYVRAITSITGTGAVLYHAIRYKDVSAIERCANPLHPIPLVRCLERMSDTDAELLWRYVTELSDVGLRWAKRECPTVPTSEEISRDIAQRRAGSSGGATDGGGGGERRCPLPSQVRSLTQGVDDLWQQLCASRRRDVPLDDALRERLRACVRANTSEITPQVLAATFPELGGGDEDPFTADECAVVERMRNLVTMDDSIPSNMMRGIEAVANRLVKDLNNGTCDLASLDLEGIGQQVISKVSDADMGAFAANIDKIIPALERVHRMP